MKRPWIVATPTPESISRLVSATGVDRVTAAVLVNRHLGDPDAAAEFLNPTFGSLLPPDAVKDLQEAANRLADAIEDRETILVFGDYDVDGITATVLLVDFIRQSGGIVDYYIPHRMSEGYGFQPDHIDRVILPSQATVVVTVDCGITSFDAVQQAANRGIDVIITDHHTPSDHIPEALAVVNPKQADCDACLDHLSGVGMAFYLLMLLRKCLRDRRYWQHRAEPNLKRFCDLVALGTVADMVPLLKENRAFTRAGLGVIEEGLRPGIQALLAVSGLGSSPMQSDDIAFRLAPRINAAGRMDRADIAARLLLTDNLETASAEARRLDDLNRQRQDIERRTVEAIRHALESTPGALDRSTIVMADKDWHEGVLGIVASRIVRHYGRPTILLTVNEGLSKGSARGVCGLDLYEALNRCRADLISFGGHAMAAGLRLKVSDLGRFHDRFDAVVAETLTTLPVVDPLLIDAEIDLTRIDPRMMDNFERLKPFGQGNPEPVLMSRDLLADNCRVIGDRHRKFVLVQSARGRTVRMPAIEFNSRLEETLPRRLSRAAFHLKWNTWNGTRSLQAVICGFDA
ncbi:MAG: single-stranded-DNA-specific exonuclease RecJ [Desulfobacterales bacterium]|jgi:single-stranded-DNA-specific exonuclease